MYEVELVTSKGEIDCGAACMAITGDFDLTEAQTRLQLEDSYKAFIR